MEHTTGEGETDSAGGTLRSGMHLHTGAASDSESTSGRDGSDRSPRLEGLSGRIGDVSRRLNSLLDDRANAFGIVRQHPLIAVGAAFAIGVALAAGRKGEVDRHWVVEQPRRKLRALLIGTATAALVSELHSLAESDERIKTLLGAYLGEELKGPDSEYADYEELDDDEDEDEDLVPPERY